MAENDDMVEPKLGPPCHKCKAVTRYRTQIADPLSQRKYDLYACTACDHLIWTPVTDK